MAVRWLPDTQNFFENVEATLVRARQQLRICDVESSQNWITKLETLEESFSLLNARVIQAYPERQRLHELVGNLLQVISFIKIQLGITALRVSDQDALDQQNVQINHLVRHTGEVGRPRCGSALEEHQLRFFRDNLGLRWADIARCLGVSERTLRRRRYELGLLSMEGNYANLSDERLDDHVRDVLQTTPRIGLGFECTTRKD